MPSDFMSFTFDDRRIEARPGQSVAAALTDAGIHVFRETTKGGERGIFCGMGVCQDCLVTVDGMPNQRACMTPVREGLAVARQTALATLGARQETTAKEPRLIAPDVLVIGGGAGGLSASIEAARAGASVTLIDERKVGGGQYYKQTATGEEPLDSQQADGAGLIRDAVSAGVEIIRGAEVWGAFDGPVIMADLAGSALVARPKTLIVATGAYERPRMVPGWTLPGVMTTGAAQTLWRSYRSLVGKRVAISGSGPLNLQVAAELARGGAKVVMVAEAAPSPFARPLQGLALLTADAALAAKGMALLAALRAKGVPVRFSTSLQRIEQAMSGLRATFARDGGSETSIDVDAICMNEGFEPQNEILRLLGAEMRYDKAFGHLRCVRNEGMRTSVGGLYAVGDCAGLGGAPAALVEGRIAGRAAAAEAGHGKAGATSAETRELARHRQFQSHLWSMYRPAPRLAAEIADETIVCRCEEITASDIRRSMKDDPAHVGTVKRATRVGMGRCQGRYCGPVAVRLLAEAKGGEIGDLSYFAPRVPIKPVAISAIVAAQEALDAKG